MDAEEGSGSVNWPTIHTPDPAMHSILTPGTESSVPREQMESYTMVLNAHKVKQMASKLTPVNQSNRTQRKSGGSSSPKGPCGGDRMSSKSDTLYQKLPPPANQVLRTAQWVNNVNNELSDPAAVSAFQSQELHSPASVTQAEINHHKSPLTSPHAESQHQNNKPQQGSPAAKSSIKMVDLATSEV